MSYKTSPFLSKILVEKPSRRTILSGEGRPKAKRGSMTKEARKKTITPRNANLASLAHLLVLDTLEKLLRLSLHIAILSL
jgi:hypothetical protein